MSYSDQEGTEPLWILKSNECGGWLELDMANGELAGVPPKSMSCKVTVRAVDGAGDESNTLTFQLSPRSKRKS